MTNDEPAVRLTGLTKRYGRVPAAAGIDLTVRTGETVALLGPNGAGKSTTIAILLGQARPDSGEAALFGLPPERAVRAGRVGAMLQDCRLPWYATVGELVELSRATYPRPLPTAEIVAAAGLAGLTGRRLEKLSGGEAQRASFGFAVAGDPDLLVLDEPTTGMDVAARRQFWTTVRQRAGRGRTVLFATHYLAEADEFADRVVVLAAGRVVADGTSAQLRRSLGCRQVSFRLAGAPDGDTEPATGRLAQLPGVRSVTVQRDRVILSSADADATVAALFRDHSQVRDLEVTSGGLTEAFFALTGAPDESPAA